MLLLVIYAFNFIDRQIVVILAPSLKTAFAISDAQIGLLYGTSFAVFYSLFGIPLAKFADGASRKVTLACGLCVWSSMTALSGLSGTFAQLGLARLGVGVGEASASPAAISLLADYFPKRIRGTAFAIFAVGMYLGMGASLMIGGFILARWNGWLGLEGWQAAFLLVGAPGLVLAALVMLTVREPVRGRLDGLPHAGSAAPVREVLGETLAMIAPWVRGRDVGERLALRRAMAVTATVIVIGAALLVCLTGLLTPSRLGQTISIGPFTVSSTALQWMIIGIGLYAATGWVFAVRVRDPEAYALTVGGRGYRLTAIACALLGMLTYGTGAFVFLYGSRYLGLRASDGFVLGLISAVAGGSGTAIGGVLGDYLRRRVLAGRIILIMVTLIGFTAASLVQFTTVDRTVFFASYGIALLFLTFWPPLMLATAQDLVPPRLRGVGFAVQTLATSLAGLGVGPYAVGLMSDVTGDLRFAMLAMLGLIPVLLAVLWRTAIAIGPAEAALTARA